MGSTYDTLIRIFCNLYLNTVINSRIHEVIMCQGQKHPEGNPRGKDQ